MAALAASPLGLLDARGCLRLVTDLVYEDDALCLALACRALRDALWARFPRRPAAGDAVYAGKRLVTREVALVATAARVIWARELAAAEDGMNNALEDDGRIELSSELAPRLTDIKVFQLAARRGALATLQWAHKVKFTGLTQNSQVDPAV